MAKSNTNLLHLKALQEFGVVSTQDTELLSRIAFHLDGGFDLTIDEALIEITYITVKYYYGTERQYIVDGIRQELLVILLAIVNDHCRFMKTPEHIHDAMAGVPWTQYLFATGTPLIKDDYARIGTGGFGRGLHVAMQKVIRRRLIGSGHEYTLAWAEVVSSMVSAFAWRVKYNGTLANGGMSQGFWLSQAEVLADGLLSYIANLCTIRDHLRAPI